MCLRQIRAWVESDNCPNYFIPGENMFDRITNKELMVTLGNILDTILSSDLDRQFDTLKTDNIGTHMRKRLHNLEEISSYNVQRLQLYAIALVLTDLMFYRDNVMYKRLQIGVARVVENLERNKRSIDRTEAETKIAKSLIWPFINVARLSSEVVKNIRKNDESLEQSLKCKDWDQQWPIHCYSKLKQASAMLMLGNYQSSNDELLAVKDRKRFSFCPFCSPNYYLILEEKLILSMMQDRTDITVPELLADFLQPCVVFLPSERHITPTAINYEMIRSFPMSPESKSLPHKHLRYELGVVDGNFLIHFLLYLNYRALGQEYQATREVRNMIHLLNDKSVGHRETYLNLLGWIHIERGDIRLAVQSFQKSLETVSTHNAAFWHLCFLICGIKVLRWCSWKFLCKECISGIIKIHFKYD